MCLFTSAVRASVNKSHIPSLPQNNLYFTHTGQRRSQGGEGGAGGGGTRRGRAGGGAVEGVGRGARGGARQGEGQGEGQKSPKWVWHN